MAKLDAKVTRKMGLSLERLQTHANRVHAALSGKTDTHIPVEGACTPQNGGVISWSTAQEWLMDVANTKGVDYFLASHEHWATHHLVTMVPAAGAASRFLGELRKFTDEVELKAVGLAESIRKKQKKQLPQCEKYLEMVAGIEMKPTIAELADKVEEQLFPDVVREYLRLGSLLGLFEGVELLEEEANGGEKLEEPSEREWRSHWSDPLDDVLEDMDESDEADTMDGVGACSDCNCDDDCSYSSCCGGECGDGCSDCDCEGDSSLHHAGALVMRAYSAAKAILNLYSGEPKALVPTTVEGDSFLRLKMVEQISTLRSLVNVLVVPAGQKQRIQKILKAESSYLTCNYSNVFNLHGTPMAPSWLRANSKVAGAWEVMEQGNDLSTIRFGVNGEPVVEKGQYSLVAAGHGELVHLFSKVAAAHPEAECLHVRNIDNVVGASSEVYEQLGGLSDAFRVLRDTVEFLRHEVSAHIAELRGKKDVNMTNLDACKALDFLGVLLDGSLVTKALSPFFSADGDFVSVSADSMATLLSGLFHWPEPPKGCSGKALWQFIEEQLSRPVSVFGVVKKEDGDVGGGPVFIRLPDGTKAKLCMEMPHANDADSKKYFAAGGSCTHFNPVLTFFELKTHGYSNGRKKVKSRPVDFRRLFDDRFWMLSRKEHQGKPVCYHETVLYELIGNSATTNLVFFEVPRSLFVPHKTIFESLGRSREFYGFAETLGKRNGNES
jgi:hypothetical protein